MRDCSLSVLWFISPVVWILFFGGGSVRVADLKSSQKAGQCTFVKVSDPLILSYVLAVELTRDSSMVREVALLGVNLPVAQVWNNRPRTEDHVNDAAATPVSPSWCVTFV